MYMKFTGIRNIERHLTEYLSSFLSYFKELTENCIRTNIYGPIVVTFHNATHMLYFETFRFVYKEFFFQVFKSLSRLYRSLEWTSFKKFTALVTI